MDKPLRAYARKRREAAGQPVLHPVNRRMLQAEAARLRPPAGPGRWTPWAWLGWPRLAFAAALCIVLGWVLWNALPDKPGTPDALTLARLDRTPDVPLMELPEEKANALDSKSKDENLRFQISQPAPAARGEVESLSLAAVPALTAPARTEGLQRGQSTPPAPSPAPPPRARESRGGVPAVRSPGEPLALFEESEKPLAVAQGATAPERFYRAADAAAAGLAAATPPPAPAPAPLPPPATPMIVGADSTRRRLSSAPSPANRPPAPTTSAFVLVTTESGAEALGVARTAKRFRYQSTGAAGEVTVMQRATVAAPLAYFDFEQDGARVRLIETNGSIYEGLILATNTASFRVSGTNRATGRRVSVEGEFVDGTAAKAALDAASGLAAPRFGSAPSRAARSVPPAPTDKPAPPSPEAAPADAFELQAGRALYLRIRPEGVPETRTLAVPASK